MNFIAGRELRSACCTSSRHLALIDSLYAKGMAGPGDMQTAQSQDLPDLYCSPPVTPAID